MADRLPAISIRLSTEDLAERSASNRRRRLRSTLWRASLGSGQPSSVCHTSGRNQVGIFRN